MLDDLYAAMDPDPAWLPEMKRLEIVNDEGFFAVPCHDIFVFARGGEPVREDYREHCEMYPYESSLYFSLYLILVYL